MNKYIVFAETIKDFVSPQEATEMYGIKFNKIGFAICPIHNEKTPSFKIFNNKFYCFGCSWHGDIIDLVQQLFNLSFTDAIIKINDDFSVGLPINRKLTLRERRDIQRRQRKIVAERKKRETSDFLYELRCDSLWTEWFLLDQIKTMYAPKPDDDEWPPEFCKVLNEMPYLEYQIDCLL